MNVVSASLPSSGGLVLAEVLNILENHDLSSMDRVDFVHVLVEAMRRGYRDRAQYMGDSAFVEVPVAMLQDKYYARGQNQSLRMDRATPSIHLAPTWTDAGLGEDTTHFSIIDEDGNRVAATLSINYPFGSGVMPPGTGVLLNDEMDDFSAKPGAPNAYGLVGARANAIEPGKRMLSSMSPTFLETGDRVAVLGYSGWQPNHFHGRAGCLGVLPGPGCGRDGQPAPVSSSVPPGFHSDGTRGPGGGRHLPAGRKGARIQAPVPDLGKYAGGHPRPGKRGGDRRIGPEGGRGGTGTVLMPSRVRLGQAGRFF